MERKREREKKTYQEREISQFPLTPPSPGERKIPTWQLFEMPIRHLIRFSLKSPWTVHCVHVPNVRHPLVSPVFHCCYSLICCLWLPTPSIKRQEAKQQQQKFITRSSNISRRRRRTSKWWWRRRSIKRLIKIISYLLRSLLMLSVECFVSSSSSSSSFCFFLPLQYVA